MTSRKRRLKQMNFKFEVLITIIFKRSNLINFILEWLKGQYFNPEAHEVKQL